MNKILLIWNLCLTALVVFLFVSGNPLSQSAPKELSDSSASVFTGLDTTAPISAKVVYINNDTLFRHFKMYDDLQEELMAEAMKLERQYRREVEKLEKDYLAFKENAWSMTNAQQEKIQQDLMQKQQQLALTERELTQKAAMKENEVVKRIKRAIEDYLEKQQAQYGYDFVLSKSEIDGIHYANKSQNITYQVIDGLNADYEASKAVKKETE